MATDMFRDILPLDEEERRRLHAEAMGMLPPALRIQMTSPFGGGIGPQLNQYQGRPVSPRVPHHSQPGGYFEQNITPIPTDVTVDPTMAGMAGVTQNYGPFSRSLGALSGMLAPAPSSSLPSYFDDPEVTKEMEALVDKDTADFAKDVLSQKVDDFSTMRWAEDPVSTIGGLIRDPLAPVELPEIIDRTPRYTSPMPRLSPEDMAPQTGFTPVGFTTGGWTGGGTGNVDHHGNVFSVQNKSPFNLGHINPYGLSSQEPLPVTVPVLPGLGLGLTAGAVTAATAGEGVQPGEPYSGMGDPSDAFSTGHPGMMGATGYDLSGADIEPSVDVQSQVDTFAGMGDVFAGEGDYTGDPDLGLEEPVISPLDLVGAGLPGLVKGGYKGLVNLITKGATKKSDTVVPLGVTKKGKTVLSDEFGPIAVVDSTDPVITTAQAAAKQINKIGNPYARQMARAKAIEDAKSAGAGVVQLAVTTAALSPKGALERKAAERQKAAADKERTRMHDLAVAQAAARHEQNVAAAKAKHEENLRIAELTRQASARQAQIAREVQDAQDRVRQARQIMNSRDYQEGGMGSLSAAQRDIVAAAQVDTFAGMRAEGPMSEAEINVAGGMEFGGAGGMAGSDRGGGGRGGWGPDR